MGVKPCPIVTHGMRQQDFCGETGNSDPSLFEKLLTL
jgi:hypothetical protein